MDIVSYANDTNIAYAIPTNGLTYKSQCDIVVNLWPGYSFYDGTNGGGSLPPNYKDLRTVLRHEFGHCAGLNHQNDQASRLMYYAIANGAIKQIHTDELNGIAFLYDPNNTNIRANVIDGTLPNDTPSEHRTAGYYDQIHQYVGHKGPGLAYGLSCCPLAYNGGMTWSASTGASSWFAFNGSRITYEYTKAYNRGPMTIYLDNQVVASFNGVDPLNKLWRVRRTFDVAPGDHIIEVRGQGGGNAYFDTDAYIVDISRRPAGTHDSLGSGGNDFIYLGAANTWTHCSTCSTVGQNGVAAHNNSISWSNVTDNGIVFTFVGNQITYVYSKHNNRGIVKVTIDGEVPLVNGQPQPTIDLYANTPVGSGLFQQSTVYNLTQGTHTIHLAVTGTKNPSSQGTYIDLDRFIVQ